MRKIKCFGVIGGDMRQVYCARSILEDGYEVLVGGFDKCDAGLLSGLHCVSPEDAVRLSDAVILPLPVSKDGSSLFAPLSGSSVDAAALISITDDGKPLLCGLEGRLPAECLKGKKCSFYGKRDDLAAANAVPTAEGAIELAMKLSDITICNSRCLVIGFGRIGKVLSLFLKGLGAQVTVSARRGSDLELIRAEGMTPIHTGSLRGSFDYIFNTVPALVLDGRALSDCGCGALVIDLASLPGGVDKAAAKRMNIPVYSALSLPGKVAPKSAGVIIKKAVYSILEEEGI